MLKVPILGNKRPEDVRAVKYCRLMENPLSNERIILKKVYRTRYKLLLIIALQRNEIL